MENFASIYEWVGYGASALVVISLMMSSIIYLRWINLAGAALMSLYGFLISAMPVGFLNLIIVFIDLYYLKKIYFTNEFFSILKIRQNSYYLSEFIDFYKPEIKKFMPEFVFLDKKADVYIFILRNMIPAGLFIGNIKNNTLYIDLDFVIPEYRDFKIAKFLFIKNKDYFKKKSINKVLTKTSTKQHAKYLKKMGFKKENVENEFVTFSKNI